MFTLYAGSIDTKKVFNYLSIFHILLYLYIIPSLLRYTKSNTAMYWTAGIISIVLWIALAYCDNVRRSFPLNFIILSLLTICESYILGIVSAHYDVEEELMAMAIATLGITLCASQTKYDFTTCNGFLVVALIVLLCFGFLAIFFHGRVIRLVYASLGALIFGMYLVFDTQLIMGGKKKYSIGPEEYIFAALNLYVDIVTLFPYILEMIGLVR